MKISNLTVKDIRFPTSLEAHGSDAMHSDPDYSCAYVVLRCDEGTQGYGLTFTIGRGTEIVVQAVKSLAHLVIGKDTTEIFSNFAAFWRSLTSESQLRWVGPEKGVLHLATAAIVNALWDMWARMEGKPVWKLLADMDPETLVSTIDFRYITDVVTKEEALQFLREMQDGKAEREAKLISDGYPAYTTQVGWSGYPMEKVKSLCEKYIASGFDSFKIKVGQTLDEDIRRCRMVRNLIGWDNKLMVDANQVWDVEEAIERMKALAEFKPLWIEEPTSPDDVLGHLAISKALKPLGIGVATGEMCCNRVLFKQFLQAGAMQYCQIDSCRIGGVNEVLAVYFMAKKFRVPVCPHAGGVGLSEMVQHLQMFDYVCLSGTMEGRVIESVDQQQEHFEHPAIVKKSRYMAPINPGYSTYLKQKTVEEHEYPCGRVWKELIQSGRWKSPADNVRV
ncbi:mitochondrial enolase superfamily member 1-like [Ischnura elegans]|uniref:mitochondrial enolase superfamily member 1-like n=1 Tax=Ischnura elegans TaxID=197161 RepID=UPI001ED88626|nr:mitochondrial enolase superfamily member 1-like [Ischnura elegans]